MQVRIQNRIAMQQRASRAASNDDDSEGTHDAEHGGAGSKREADASSAPGAPPAVRRKLNRPLWDTMENQFDQMQPSLWQSTVQVRFDHVSVMPCGVPPERMWTRLLIILQVQHNAVQPSEPGNKYADQDVGSVGEHVVSNEMQVYHSYAEYRTVLD